MVTTPIEDSELESLRTSMMNWEGESLPLIEEMKQRVNEARVAMDAEPPQLYALSNSLVELSILNIRLIDRIIMAKYTLNSAQAIYEQRREGWKVKLAQGYSIESTDEETGEITPLFIDGIAAGIADSKKVSMVVEERELMNQAEYNYDMVNLTRRAIEKAMDAIRSKLSYEKAHET